LLSINLSRLQSGKHFLPDQLRVLAAVFMQRVIQRRCKVSSARVPGEGVCIWDPEGVCVCTRAGWWGPLIPPGPGQRRTSAIHALLGGFRSATRRCFVCPPGMRRTGEARVGWGSRHPASQLPPRTVNAVVSGRAACPDNCRMRGICHLLSRAVDVVVSEGEGDSPQD
jgi:hypothetical protein